MSKSPPQLNPREDFPVKRLVGMLILANMIFFGSLFLLALAGEIFDGIYRSISRSINYGDSVDLKDIAKDTGDAVAGYLEDYRDDSIEHPEFLALVFVGGSVAGLIWYVIARQLETRNLKKRLGLLTKSCTSAKPDVKSPQS